MTTAILTVTEKPALNRNPITRNQSKVVHGTYALTVEVISTQECDGEVFWVDVRDEQGRLVKSTSFPTHSDAYLHAFSLGI